MSALTDLGFLDPEAARRAIRRLKLRQSLLDSQASITAILDRLDQFGETLSDWKSAFGNGGFALAEGDGERGISGNAIDGVECQHVRKEQLLQGADLILQFLSSLFERLGQGLFSASGVSLEANCRPDVAESKKGGGN